MKTTLKIFILAVFVMPAAGSTITIGAPGNAFDGDCAPFGCAVEYQQVYGAGLFPGAISITGLTFFNNNFVPGSIAAANYTISLSTTAKAVNGLDAMFADNLGADNQTFFNGSLGGLIGPSNQFTISGMPFAYNPANGNLLLSVLSDGGGQDYSVFLDYFSNAPTGVFSRISSFDMSGMADTVQTDTGLITQLTYNTANSEVPEPTSSAMFETALIIFGITKTRSLCGRHRSRRS